MAPGVAGYCSDMPTARSSPASSRHKPPVRTGLARIWHALFYSLSGLRYAATHESAFRQEVVLAVVLSIVAVLAPIETSLRLILVSSHLLVLIVELLNTAIEAVVDKASPEFHDLAKQAKDMASAAVLLAITGSLICWGVALHAWLRGMG